MAVEDAPEPVMSIDTLLMPEVSSKPVMRKSDVVAVDFSSTWLSPSMICPEPTVIWFVPKWKPAAV